MSKVYFGNVSLGKFQELMGIELTKDDFEWFKERHSESVDYGDNGFHIFSLPSLQIHCGKNIEEELIKRLTPYDYSNAQTNLTIYGETNNE